MSQIAFSAKVDAENLVDETAENNNMTEITKQRTDLMEAPPDIYYQAPDFTVRVRGLDARMYTIRNGRPFRFDISSGKKFDFFITLMNYCSPENSIKIDIVFDWAPLKSDGDNIFLKKNLQVHFPYAGQLEIGLDNIKIPSKQKFQRDFSTFAVLAHHEKGYDVLFSSPVEVRD